MFDVTISDVRFFISPPMVNIVLNILSKLGASPPPVDTESERTSSSDLFKIKPNDPNAWYLSYIPVGEEATEETIESTEEQSISSKQQMYLNIKSISIVIESGGIDSQPLVKLNSYFNGKLVGYKSLTANCSLIADYYNENHFFWEPLIEPIENKSNPWDFEMKVLLEENGKIDVKLESNEQLELTITKTSLFVLSSLNEAFANAIARQLPPREDNVVIVRNFLGFDLRLYLSNTNLKPRSSKTQVKSIDDQTVLIKSGTEISLVSTDLKDIELNLGLCLTEQDEIIRKVTCHGHVLR